MEARKLRIFIFEWLLNRKISLISLKKFIASERLPIRRVKINTYFTQSRTLSHREYPFIIYKHKCFSEK